MAFLRASQDSAATPTPSAFLPQSSEYPLTPAAEPGSRALFFVQDAKWIGGVAVLYISLVVLGVLALHPYFSQTWDVATFINAGKSARSPEWNLLYAQSRADRYWPYAYPPLHAFVVSPFVAVAGFVPDFVMVRVPPLLFDVALGILLYAIVARKTVSKNFARLAMILWLLNPVTWYDTAVQGHFEAEWLFFIVLAYFLYEMRRNWILATLALSTAFLFKQNAILFALPLWAQMFFGNEEKILSRRLFSLLASFALFTIPILGVSLPFLVASNDYWYMNVQYVAAVPLQTQSWLVALAGIFGAENFVLRASSLLTLSAAALISIFSARRKMDLWLAGTLIALAFFLLSKKVVGYYYVAIVPFAVVTLIPTKSFRLLTLIGVAVSFISLSPYFASWANQEHVWLYGALGVLNSALWLGIFIWLWREHSRAIQFAQNARVPAFLSLGLFLSCVAASLLQPFINSQASPIRAPLITSGSETQAFLTFLAYLFLVFLSIIAAIFFTRSVARASSISRFACALVVSFTPLYFLTFTLTKESTTAFELLLKNFGF